MENNKNRKGKFIMEKFMEFVKKPVVWITGLIAAAIGGILAAIFCRRK